jgi:pimeloyl-ACP methyl ester carboxylesterase
MMSLVRHELIGLVVNLFFLLAANHHSSLAAPASDASVRPADVQVDLYRGLADIFSRGMDTLTHRLNQEGYSARVYSTNQWPSAASRISSQYSHHHKIIVVLIGHSLGGNAIFDAAYELDRRNIPVELLVSFDATSPRPVPKNVFHVVNFYQQNGFGKQVVPSPDFKGQLNNIDLTAETGLSHTTIDKSPRLHAMVMTKIQDVVEKDLKARVRATKKKAVKKKSAPVSPAAQ